MVVLEMSNVISFCDYRQKRLEERSLDELINNMSEQQLLDLVEDLTYTRTVLDNYELGTFKFTIEIDDIKDTP